MFGNISNGFFYSFKNCINSSYLRKEFIQYSRSFLEFDEAVGFYETFIDENKLLSEFDNEVENEKYSDGDENQVGDENNFETLVHMYISSMSQGRIKKCFSMLI